MDYRYIQAVENGHNFELLITFLSPVVMVMNPPPRIFRSNSAIREPLNGQRKDFRSKTLENERDNNNFGNYSTDSFSIERGGEKEKRKIFKKTLRTEEGELIDGDKSMEEKVDPNLRLIGNYIETNYSSRNILVGPRWLISG